MTAPVWNTAPGSIGTYPADIFFYYQLSASPQPPATLVTYSFLSGEFPAGITMDEFGYISGTPSILSRDTTYTFAIRVTDDLGSLRDRTFTITISGVAAPEFTTPPGNILTELDSIWIETPILYSNPISTNPIKIRLIQGILPPGLEINDSGLIRGYAEPPTTNINLGLVVTYATVTTVANVISCFSTTGFSVGRPITFTGAVFGGISTGSTYYIKQVIDANSFTISTTQNGPVYSLSNATGFMTITLPNVSVGQPSIRTYSFVLKLESPIGTDLAIYNITIINQNTPPSQGGPGYPANSRLPTIYNTRPPTYDIRNNPDYGYYILPDGSNGETYPPTSEAYIGQFLYDNYFSFKVLGHDFDGNDLEYTYAGLPEWLTGDPNTGWITGTAGKDNDFDLAPNSISEFNFSVTAKKAAFPSFYTPDFSFTFRVSRDITGIITWITSSNLGQIFNGTVSVKSVLAESDVSLSYRLVSGELPPNLQLLSNGEITGKVAYQPTDSLLEFNDTTTFTFTIEAYSPTYSIVNSQKTFTLTVVQEFTQPTDTLYIKAAPSIEDRALLRTLLEGESSEQLMPTEYLYRPSDANFGKATNVTYVHAYGIYASDLDEYIAAVTKNHYWRNIILGELETAVAKDENGNVIYEVVYSKVIDNLLNPQGISISEEIYWPRFIDLQLGPWYTSSTEIYTSYIYPVVTEDNILSTENNIFLTTESYELLSSDIVLDTFFTSLTPGYARILYPNSLPNMRARVGQELGQEYNSNLLPLWMTSQQNNGSTLGFTPCWVICYTKPYVVVDGQPVTYAEFAATGLDRNNYQSYAEIIKNNIQQNWVDFLGRPNKLNKVDFQIDRFTVDKSQTYDFNNDLNPPAWTGLPSATPTPDPVDSKDFYVLFPRKTILPNRTQYNR